MEPRSAKPTGVRGRGCFARGVGRDSAQEATLKHISIVLAALVIVLGYHAVTKADAPPGVTKWEYKAIRLGKRGWDSLGQRVGLAAMLPPKSSPPKLPSDAEMRSEYESCDKDKDGVLSRADGPDWGGIGAKEAQGYDTNADTIVSLEEYVAGVPLFQTYPLMDQNVVRAGMDGWELASFGVGGDDAILLFKRPLK